MLTPFGKKDGIIKKTTVKSTNWGKRAKSGGGWNLGSQNDEKGQEETNALFVISLHDSNGADGVGVAAAVGDAAVSKNGDDYMLLHVERAGVQTELPSEQMEVPFWESGGHEAPNWEDGDLHKNGGDGERLRAVSEESVEENEEATAGQTQNP